MKTTSIPSLWTRASVLAVTLFGLGLAASAGTVTVSDDFNYTGNLNSSKWNQNTTYLCTGYEAYNTAVNGMAYYKNLDLGTGAFSVTAPSRNENNSEYAGIVFNVQDANNYYVFRWRVLSQGSYDNNLQILRVTGGAIAAGEGVIVSGLTVATPYRDITITGNGLGYFSATMTNANPFTLTWTDTTYSGGSAGIYYSGSGTSSGNYSLFDSFSATYTVPEPASLGLLALGGLALLRRRR